MEREIKNEFGQHNYLLGRQLTYHEFLLYATRRLKLKFQVVEFCVRSFLRKYNLSKKTIECYLLWDGQRGYCQNISQKLGVDDNTVWQHLKKLEFVCPELFIQGCVPDIPWMFHPSEEEWKILNEYGLIKEKF